MYEAHFGLKRPPFPPTAEPDYYFPAEAIETARQNLLRCLVRAEGTGLVVGPSGTGKTLLCRVLREQLQDTMAVVHLCSGRLGSQTALYQAILHGLDQPYRGMEESELRLALTDYLTTTADHREGLVLLVDEAHTLPLRLLDELRMLTNLTDSGQSRVRILLAGNPVLEERFTSPKLESFSQRLVVRAYLESFHRAETQQYVQSQIEAAGGDSRRLFPLEAATAVHQATDGVPRLINQLCDHALLLAYTDDEPAVDVRTVEAAWADLQQLPTPWSGESAEVQSPSVIEFGGLTGDVSTTGDQQLAEEPPSFEVFSAEEGKSSKAESWEDELPSLDHAPAAEGESFQPAGIIGPEDELAFDEDGGPFTESFTEEEEVVQPFRGAAVANQMESSTPPRAETQDDQEPFAGEPIGAGPRETRLNSEVKTDIIVVDEDDQWSDRSDVSPPVVHRQKQFSNLFAKLRQG